MSRILILTGAICVALLLLFSLSSPPMPEGLTGSELAMFPSTPPQGDVWFQEHVVDNPKLVLVDFTAAWCGPCRQMLPVLERVAADCSDRVDLVKVDIDERPAIAAHYQASSIPLVLLMKGGAVLDGLPGFSSPEGDYQTLRKLIDKHSHGAE